MVAARHRPVSSRPATRPTPGNRDPADPHPLNGLAVVVGVLAGLLVAVHGGGPPPPADNRGFLPPFPTVRSEVQRQPVCARITFHQPRMTVVAHRGASTEAPENTVDAVLLAARHGADLVEVDVRQTRDRVLVAMHDSTLKRTTDVERVFPKRRPWKVSAFTYREIRRLDAGAGFGAGYPVVRVPTLRQVLDTLAATRAGALLEVKTPRRYPGIAARLARTITRHPVAELVIASRDWEFVRRYKHRHPEATVAVIGTPAYHALPRVAGYADMVNPKHGTADARYLRRIHQLGMTSFSWTVDEGADMRELLRIGADGLVTNRPEVVAGVLYTARGIVV